MNTPDNNKPKQIIEAKENSSIQNVIQAVINLPAWAWIFGVVILSIALLLGSAMFNVGPLQVLFPTSTPTAFAPATEEETLIVVADFQDLSEGKNPGITPAQYVIQQLRDQIRKDNLNIRIEPLHRVVDENTARSEGQYYNATMVVSGWYNAVTITPRITRIKTLDGRISAYEGIINISLSSPDSLEFKLLTDTPAQTNYLVMFILGMDRYVNKDYSGAEIYLTNALNNIQKTKLNPSEVYRFRGNVYFLTEEYEKAKNDYNEVNNRQPEAKIYKNLAVCYHNLDDFQNAIKSLDMAIELDENDAENYYMRALDKLLLLAPEVVKQGDPSLLDIVIEDLDQVVKLDQNYVDEAIEMRKLVAEVYFVSGATYSDKGDYDSAIADYDKAIEINSEFAIAYYNRGLAYMALDRTEDAKKDFEYILKISTDPELRKRAEEELKKLKEQ